MISDPLLDVRIKRLEDRVKELEELLELERWDHLEEMELMEDSLLPNYFDV